MPRALTQSVIRLLILPLLLLLSGAQAGTWHCADGHPCEVATVLTCCCGCPEGGESTRHSCEDEGEEISAAPCGCYFEAQQVQARQALGSSPLQQAPALLPSSFRATTAARFCQYSALGPVTGGPPGYRISPRDTRGPPG